ncbi:Tyrosine-protein kinase [Parasponia andersonii]|uniref:Tyrosine-protein kinase n=1 Tax=Parasponia andersonii TaxID=3476 RepID=A0A2P5B4A5_PARAD|nr:Tyrosine-protein kinase [Parasponia andersonii]
MAVDRLLLRPYLFFSTITFLGGFSSLTYSMTESDALLKLKASFTNLKALDSWVPGSSPCGSGTTQWNGLLCYNGIVTGLRLEGFGLSGEIDVSALGAIKGLRTISLSNNSFAGPIPDLTSLSFLRALYLAGNQFSGDIPADYFSGMDALKKLWLSGNKFTGSIPSSLSKLSRLIELHLENNQFGGIIPPFDNIPTLLEINFSNNRLEGEIPESLSRFDASSFAGNPGLCGKELVNKECRTTEIDVENMSSSEDDSKKIVAATVTSGAVIVSLVVLIIVRSKRNRKEDFDKLGKESGEHRAPVEVHVTSLNKKEMESVRKMGSVNGSTRKGGPNNHARGSGSGVVAEIVMVNEEKGVFGMPDLMKAAAEVLGNGGLGSSYKAVMANGIAVVVKRTKDMNVKGKEQFDTEIRRLGKLKHWNVLSPLAYHYRKEEKLVVSEYVPNGSLLYLLHGDHGSSHVELNWPARLKIVRGIAKGLGYLHTELTSFDLPHGNLKSSNVLLGPDYEPLISDYGFSPLIHPTSVSQAMFAYKTPEAIEHNQVSPKSDVYCLGIIILEILMGKFPSQYLNTAKGGTDVVQCVNSAISEGRETELLDPKISNIASRNPVGEMLRLLHVGAACTERSPELRPDIVEAIRRIEEVQIEGGQERTSDITRAMPALPSLRDGYVDATPPQVENGVSLREDHGEESGRRLKTGESFAFTIS